MSEFSSFEVNSEFTPNYCWKNELNACIKLTAFLVARNHLFENIVGINIENSNKI